MFIKNRVNRLLGNQNRYKYICFFFYSKLCYIKGVQYVPLFQDDEKAKSEELGREGWVIGLGLLATEINSVLTNNNRKDY